MSADGPMERARALRKKPVKTRDRREEEDLAKRSGGQRVSNSGRGRQKGDVRHNGFLYDHKYTDNDSYSITKATFEKITRDAIATPPGVMPALVLNINGLRLVVMREADHLYREQQLAMVTDK